MTDLVLSNTAPPAWRAQMGESEIEHLRFLHWALMGGELDADLASRYRWTERRNVIESYESLERVPPGEQALEAALARVSIILVEISKLRQKVLENPDNVLTPNEIMAGIDWMTQASEDYARRKADSLNWESLTPEDREVMIRAKQIQDRLLGKE